jgi:hypothetical protein
MSSLHATATSYSIRHFRVTNLFLAAKPTQPSPGADLGLSQLQVTIYKDFNRQQERGKV